MPTQFTKLSMIARLFIGALLLVLVCIGLGVLLTSSGDGSQLPVRKLRVSVSKSYRNELFNQLQEFSLQHSLSFSLSDYGTGDNFLIEILGDDIQILAVLNRPDPEIVSIGFYARSPGDPPPDEELVNDLINDIKGFLSEIPGVKIIEEN